jgi:TonB family protein
MGSALDASRLKGFTPVWCCDLAVPSFMKINFISVFCSGLLVGGTVFAQIPRFHPPSEWQSLKIQQTVEPIFPNHLAQAGLTVGMAHLAINTDPDGKLIEWLVVGFTQPEFATAAVEALRQWKFEPAQLRGEKVGTTVELIFHFEAKGVVVSTSSLSDILEAQLLRRMGAHYIYLPCSLRELDRIPTPIVTIAPTYPKELADRGVKGRVTVEFYIDESGAVRVPAVSIDDNSVLTALAVAALRQWRFEPPTRNGSPVLVKASQVFNFGAH